LKGSEIIGIVVVILFIIGLPSFFGYVNSMQSSNDMDSVTESTTDYIVDFTYGEIIGTIIIVIVGLIVSVLVIFSLVKKG
jgi:hypothetical protein